MLIADEILTIAEVGLAHDGSLGSAHAYVDAVAECGVRAIKFQTHIAEEESTKAEQFRVNVFPQDASRFDYWKRTGFEKSQWLELASHAREKNLFFLSSPFSNLAVEWLVDCNVAAWKVASGEISNYPMLRMMCETKKPMLVSSGMSSRNEIDETLALLRGYDVEYGIFQCTTSYPCPPEKWGLNLIEDFLSRYQCPVGLSDHSGSIVPAIAAVALGATMVEFHVTFSKSQFGPDSKASLTFPQTSELVIALEDLRRSIDNPVDKDAEAQKLQSLRDHFSKSIVAASDLAIGHELKNEDLAFKKPGTGISPKDIHLVIGKTLQNKVDKDHIFSLRDFS